jgi:SAM-dependent methyltransferase
MHPEALEAVRRMVNVSGYIKYEKALGSPERVGLDLGGADINGTARAVVPFVERWFGSDIESGPGVDWVWDATAYVPVANYDTFDVVLCTELLEHVEDWPAVVRNIWELLAPGGYAFLTFAGCSRLAGWGRRPHGARGGLHPEPGEYYGNVEHLDFVQVLAETLDGDYSGLIGPAFEVWTRPVPGDIYAWFKKGR